ncbi:hypothetical protein [Streptomyces sp. CA2R106]|uniref:hypothetical protein n=1 Tax=Streptomyces sp. CA2R106 TaxID=3120153 RepID=UPI003008C848
MGPAAHEGRPPLGIPTLVDGGSFAYRTVRAAGAEDHYELGAVGHGPHGRHLAQRLVTEIRTWDREYRGDRARIEVHPAGTPDRQLPADRRIERRHTRITTSSRPCGTRLEPANR